jgi:hypothetical protein
VPLGSGVDQQLLSASLTGKKNVWHLRNMFQKVFL